MEIGELIAVRPRRSTTRWRRRWWRTLVERLQHVVDIGLEYLSLNRETDTLSGGESQRIKMVKHLGSSLVDVMYIFDEPSVGLHPRDVHRLNELLQKLRDKGNTVLVVEHDPDVIKVADHVVDVGPHAGSAAATIVFEGSYAELLRADTLTGRHLQQALPLKTELRAADGHSCRSGTRSANNLQNVSVDIPTGVLTVVTGRGRLGQELADQRGVPAPAPRRGRDRPVGGGHLDALQPGHLHRRHGRRAQGVRRGQQGQTPALFSFNSKGACENCKGSGVIYTDLAFLDGVKTPCEICDGQALQGRGAGLQARRQVDHRRAGA